MMYVCVHIYKYIYIYIYTYITRDPQTGRLRVRVVCSGRCPVDLAWRELRGSQGMGVVSNNWLDCVLLSIVYMFKPSC